MKWHRFLPLWFAIVVIMGCSPQPISITTTNLPSTRIPSIPITTNTPTPTVTVTFQDQQVEVVKAIFRDYDGRTALCKWDESRIGCDDQGNIALLNARSLGLTSLPP